MILRSCHVENFGKLNDVLISFENNQITKVCQGNGWGKSTLAAFIKAMFYGFPKKKSRDILLNERLRYQPWQGGVYGGQLTFQVGERIYEVSRVFGEKPSQDTFRLVDLATNLPSKDYSERLGEELFEIDVESFARTAFFTQKDCVTHTTDAINAKLGEQGAASDDIDQYDRANQALNHYLNQNSPTRKTGELYKKKERMAAIRQDILGFENFAGDHIPQEAELNQMITVAQGIDGKKKTAEIYAKELEKWGDQVPYEVPKTRPRITGKTVAGGGILLAGILCLGFRWYVALALLMVGLVLVLFDYFAGREEVEGKGHEETENERKTRYETALKDYVETVKLVGEYMKGLGLVPTENMVGQLYEYRESVHEYKGKREGLEQKKKELEMLQKECQEEEEKWRLISIAQEMLERAKNQYLAQYTQPVKTGFDKYYNILSGSANKDFQVDAKMELTVKEAGWNRELCTQSAGIQDLAGVCLRMAFLDAMYTGEKPVLLLDDPFVHLDDEKLGVAEHFLQEIAKEYQVIYFTCHSSRA